VCGLTSDLATRCFVRVLGGDALGDTGSAWDCSGDADVAARLSRSSKRRFSFLPNIGAVIRRYYKTKAMKALTIVPLSDTVLNATTLCQIRNLGPVFIRVGVGTECATVGVTAAGA
jgi:hypothetical protein